MYKMTPTIAHYSALLVCRTLHHKAIVCQLNFVWNKLKVIMSRWIFFFLEIGNDHVCTNTTSIAWFYNKVSIYSPKTSPAITYNPILFFCLPNYCYSMIEWIFGTVSKNRVVFRIISGKLSSAYHGSNYITFPELILYSFAIFFRKNMESWNCILFNIWILYDFFSTRKRFTSFRPIRIDWLLN